MPRIGNRELSPLEVGIVLLACAVCFVAFAFIVFITVNSNADTAKMTPQVLPECYGSSKSTITPSTTIVAFPVVVVDYSGIYRCMEGGRVREQPDKGTVLLTAEGSGIFQCPPFIIDGVGRVYKLVRCEIKGVKRIDFNTPTR